MFPRTLSPVLLGLFGWLAFASASALAQNSVIWTTNFYSVTGASFREIRRSIEQARPFKDGFDADTRWTVRWRFNTAQTQSGCSCTSFSTTATIVTTMPRWTPPTDVAPEVKEQWTRFFVALAQHEAGHARFGLAAATEIQKQISQVGTQPDCDRLKAAINERSEKVVDDYRRREKEYDRETDHGRQPGQRR
jgi:predicted secreted Zn-dependent protease